MLVLVIQQIRVCCFHSPVVCWCPCLNKRNKLHKLHIQNRLIWIHLRVLIVVYSECFVNTTLSSRSKLFESYILNLIIFLYHTVKPSEREYYYNEFRFTAKLILFSAVIKHIMNELRHNSSFSAFCNKQVSLNFTYLIATACPTHVHVDKR